MLMMVGGLKYYGLSRTDADRGINWNLVRSVGFVLASLSSKGM